MSHGNLVGGAISNVLIISYVLQIINIILIIIINITIIANLLIRRKVYCTQRTFVNFIMIHYIKCHNMVPNYVIICQAKETK